MATKRGVAVVAGAGPGNGQALASRFSEGGYDVALLARDESRVRSDAANLRFARGYGCDLTDPASVDEVFKSIARDMGDVEALLFNAGSGVFKPLDDLSPDDFEQSWRINALGSFLTARAVYPAMVERGRGSIVFTSATAALRGGKMTAAFAPAKAAQRSYAQALAKTVGPKGVHVGLLVLDGVVDLETTRKSMPDKPDSFFIDPAGVAEAAWQMVHQNRQAWTFEADLRPFAENW